MIRQICSYWTLREFFLLRVTVVFLLAGNSLYATVNFLNGYTGSASEVNSSAELNYQADASDSDLIEDSGASASTALADNTNAGTWRTGNGANLSELNDGIHGVSFATAGNSVQGAWPNSEASATYTLGPGSNNQGFDITSVQSIAAWNGAGFGNQAWTLAVQLVGSSSFVDVATVNYQPLAGSAPGATKVTLTNLNITGIQALKITTISVNGGSNGGSFVWRELDVFGNETPVIPDETDPAIVSLNPTNGSSGVSPNGNLVATFNENIRIGTGNITILNLDSNSQAAIPVSDPQITVTSTTLTIEPASSLLAATRYAIRIEPTAIDDLSDNSFVGIGDDSIWQFTTGQPDLTAPGIISLSPARASMDAPTSGNLIATFDEDIAVGTGDITIRNLDTIVETVITLPDPRVSVAGAALTINPSTDLLPATSYSVRLSPSAIADRAGNPFSGISDDETWHFKTADTPLRIMCMGDSITVGYTDNPSWNVLFKFGYRSRLYTRLTDTRRYNFKLVGGSTEPFTGISGDPTRSGNYKPAFDLRDIGQDGHRGYGGKAVGFLNSNILTWLASDDPDVILLKIGTNSQDQSGLDTLVNTITTTKPNLHLIVAQIMPKFGFQQGIVDYNTYIRDTLVPKYQALGRKVTLVDQYAPFLTNPNNLTTIDQSLFSNGINHPDNVGYDKMADVWFAGIEALGIAPVTFASYISNPAFGLSPSAQAFDLDPDGDGIGSGLEAWFGTHPGQFNPGIEQLATDGTATTFIHPRNTTLPSDISGRYEWSTDLTDWYLTDGVAGPVGGLTVAAAAKTVGTVTTVVATASAPTGRLFLRAAAVRN